MVVKLKDIADATGKSITTVSRALNYYDDVSEETKKLVNRVAKELGIPPIHGHSVFRNSIQKQLV